MILTEEDLPVVADEILDYVGEVWTAREDKKFRTFLAYLTYHIYGREHRIND